MTVNIEKIDYKKLVDQAMHVLVQNALRHSYNNRFPDNHHFYISFATDYPGVIVSKKIKEQYPKDITIVLQHQFENLIVEQDKFSVLLTFDDIAEQITVPYESLISFVDPSVNFGVQFQPAKKKHAPTISIVESSEPTNQTTSLKTTKKENIDQSIRKTKDASDNVIALDKFRKKK